MRIVHMQNVLFPLAATQICNRNTEIQICERVLTAQSKDALVQTAGEKKKCSGPAVNSQSMVKFWMNETRHHAAVASQPIGQSDQAKLNNLP